jgi:hypothetical protein
VQFALLLQHVPLELSQQIFRLVSQMPTAQSVAESHAPPAALLGAHFLLMHTLLPAQSLFVAQLLLQVLLPHPYAPQLVFESKSFTQAKLLHL